VLPVAVVRLLVSVVPPSLELAVALVLAEDEKAAFCVTVPVAVPEPLVCSQPPEPSSYWLVTDIAPLCVADHDYVLLLLPFDRLEP